MRKTHQSRKSFNEKRPWNGGRLVGQKPPLKRKDIWAIRVWLQLEGWKGIFGRRYEANAIAREF